MIKKSIYPKTKRLPCNGEKIIVTEKLDGANLCIFKLENKLYFALRNNIINYDEIDEFKDKMYKDLYTWIKEYINDLNTIRNNSVLCGEWLGMGHIEYPDLNKRFYMFAKANINEEFQLTNLHYNKELFIYPFENNMIPNCIGIVPLVAELNNLLSKEDADKLYNEYCKIKQRKVEGFVINYNDNICKYVRYKRGKLIEHFDWNK